MNTDQLKTFLAVARTLSFTQAAEELMLSQPAVSRQIAGLEEEIDAKLFSREHNTLALTAAGALLSEELPGKLDGLENLFFQTHLVGIGKIKRLRVGILREQRIPEQALKALRSMRDADYFVNIEQYSFQGLERAVTKGDVDCAVSPLWVTDAFPGCVKHEIRKDALCLAVNTEYAPHLPEKLTRESLERVSRERPTMIPENASFSRSQYSLAAAMTAQFWNGVREEPVDMVVPMVETGIGTALVNECHVLGQKPQVKLYPLDFLPEIPVAAVYEKSAGREAVLDFLNSLDRFRRPDDAS